MRDNSRIKERYELSLDGAQVASVVVGSLVVLGAVFMLGLNVGKQVGQKAAPPAAARPENPLAALDRPAIPAPEPREKEPKLSFHDALTKGPAESAAVAEPKAQKPDPGAATTGTALNALPPPAPPATTSTSTGTATSTPTPTATSTGTKTGTGTRTGTKNASTQFPLPRSSGGEGQGEGGPTANPKASKTANKPAKAPAKPTKAPAPKKDAMASAVAKASSLPSGGSAGGFAVQVGATQSEAEAQRLQKKHAAEGARISPADVPGKGRWYRVKVGAFATRADAEKRLAALKARGVQGFVTDGR